MKKETNETIPCFFYTVGRMLFYFFIFFYFSLYGKFYIV